MPSRLIREMVEARITRRDRRGLPQTASASPATRARRAQPAHDHDRAHAERASALRRMDAGAADARGRQDRPRHRRAGRGDHAGQAPSRAGLPFLPRHPAAGAEPTAPIRLEAACRRGIDIGAAPTARSPRSSRMVSTRPSRRPERRTADRSGTATSAAAATTTDAARRRPRCSDHDPHPRSPYRPRAHRHGQGASTISAASPTSPHSPSRSGSRIMIDREVDRAAEQAARQPLEIRRAAAQPPSSRTSTAARRAVSIEPCSPSSSPATGSHGTTNLLITRPDRARFMMLTYPCR